MPGKNKVGPKKDTKSSHAKLDDYRKELDIDDHMLEIGELEFRYMTDIEKGLTESRATENLEEYGPNMLHPPKGRSNFTIFLDQMFNGFPILLWIGGIMCFVSHIIARTQDTNADYDDLYMGITLVVINMITGLFGYFHEAASKEIMESFKKMVPKNVRVIREGKSRLKNVEELVPGDLVLLKIGDQVPADIRIVECSSLKVDNSSITGESEPVQRTEKCTDDNPLETNNLVFFGTNIIEGNAKGIVIQTGDNTLIGHIAGLTAGLQPLPSPISVELNKFVKLITIIALTFASMIFAYALYMGHGFTDGFLYFIGTAVAQVPEGLSVTMTACLTLSAKRMSKKNCLVKTLHAVETLGQTSVICSDKTGTLTQNKMHVSHMYYDGAIVDVQSLLNTPPGDVLVQRSYHYQMLTRCGMLCSRAQFIEDASVAINRRKIEGDASEIAVLRGMEMLVGKVDQFRDHRPKIFEMPFNSTNKFQLSIHELKGTDHNLLVMKGAFEGIVDRCSTILEIDSEFQISEVHKHKIRRVMLELGGMGERVLAFADLVVPKNFNKSYNYDPNKGNFPMSGLRLLGFMSLIDPPKVGVLQAVLKCKTAGIRVIMVTGDHPVTAMSIAKKVGIISPENETTYDIAIKRDIAVTDIPQEDLAEIKAAVITGAELRSLDLHELDSIVSTYAEIVFARTSPQQKLQIVESFQRCGYVVAVTGDGVNDSPALKKADTGIAMGISGSDVSKEAADIILMDDNFTTIVSGIEEGRLIYDNLKKSIAYCLTSNVPELMPFLMMICLEMPPSLTVASVLLIDVGTDLWPGISLAYEEAESDIMLLPPRDPTSEGLVTRSLMCFVFLNVGLLQTLAGLSCYFHLMAQYGFLPNDLIGLRKAWNSDMNDVTDSYGVEWTMEERRLLSRMSCAAFFLAIVVTQVADCVICKTRRLSVFKHGCGNVVMVYGIFFTISLSAFAVYTPYVNKFMTLAPVNVANLWPSVPFAIIIVLFDEFRKYFIRKFPGGWAARELYF